MARESRNVMERWIVTGILELVTPASLGNGDADALIDIPVLLDPLEKRALLTGASLAGALRNNLTQYDLKDNDPTVLFGYDKGDTNNKKGKQSPLIVDDALSNAQPQIELRDGVTIDSMTRTAKDQEKYDRQLLAAGTTFNIGLELIVTAQDDKNSLLQALQHVLSNLEQGEIRLGGRKSRGYGECRVTNWSVWQYKLNTRQGLWDYLHHDEGTAAPKSGSSISDCITAYGEKIASSTFRRKHKRFEVDATLEIVDSLLIRSGFEQPNAPDASHLRSNRGGKSVPILPGTSLAGVLRAQALRIINTFLQFDNPAQEADAGTRHEEAQKRIRNLFGGEDKDKKNDKLSASRVIVSETVIEGAKSCVQSRVKIDRFTGGAFESALFAEQPEFGGTVNVKFAVERPQEREIGLMLLVLKDVWTGHIAVGGGANVGRGRLQGQTATITYGDEQWHVINNDDNDAPMLENGIGNEQFSAFIDEFYTDWLLIGIDEAKEESTHE